MSEEPAPRRRAHYLLISEYRILNDWCCLVKTMFEDDSHYGLYLVGSVLCRPDHRDVDIRLILPDEVFAAHYASAAKRLYLNLAVSLWGQKVTGLPIDFQIQDRTRANERYPGQRNAIGYEDRIAEV